MKTYRIEMAITYSKVFEVKAKSEGEALKQLQADNMEQTDEVINRHDYCETAYNLVNKNGCFVKRLNDEGIK